MLLSSMRLLKQSFLLVFLVHRSRVGSDKFSDFFDPENAEGERSRLHMAIAALGKVYLKNMLRVITS